jgi:ornithine carbamoyltransferase
MRHFLALSDFTPEGLSKILNLAAQLKKEWHQGGNPPRLESKVLAMVFQKPSLRTRVSFDMAMRHLGGDALFLSPAEIGLGKREAISDISRVLSGYVDAIMARVFSHDHVLELAEYASVPVINGLSDFNHPCQAMADALTMIEHFNRLEGLSLSYIGDGNNVAVSLLFLSALMGMDFAFASPEGYEIPEDIVAEAISLAKESGASIHQTTDPYEAVENANVIYTDSWTSMGQEEEIEKRRKVFPPYQVNSHLLSAANHNAIVLHCLPAHRGEEITDEVADGPQSAIFQQAENRMHAQKAILVHLLT